MLIYGRNVCEVALKENVKIRKIYLQEGFSDKKLLNMIEKIKLKPTYLLKRKMDDLVNGIHQGIIFDVSDYKYADIKTSAGCAYQMDIVKVVNLARTIDYLKSNNYWVVGTSLDTDLDYREVDYSGNICLVIGNEGKGISSLISKKCDFITKIPMYGRTNSLNASVAAGIMIYEVIRNRK